MTAVLFRLRAEARSRWHAWVALALLAGMAGGVAIATLAGARRTETAYPRFLKGTRAFDVFVTNGTTPDNINRQFNFDEVARLPQVLDVARVNYYFPSGTAPSGRSLAPSDLTPVASSDGRFGRDMNRARLLKGRVATLENEVAVTFLGATNLGVGVGDTIRLQLLGPQALANGPGAGGAPTPFRVVGVVAMQGGFPPLTGGLPPLVMLSSAYARSHPDASQVLAVRLHAGTGDIPAFDRELGRRAHGMQVVTTDRLEQTSAVQRSLAVQATGLRVFAVLVALVALLLLGQAIARQGFVDAEGNAVLRALGTTRAQMGVLGATRALLIGLLGAIMAVGTAVALSPLTPVGVARRAEIHPGFEVNAAYAIIGAGAVLLAVLVLGSLSAWRSGRLVPSPAGTDGGARRSSRLVLAGTRLGLSAPATSGVRMALEPRRGGPATAVRSTIISVALAVATIAGALSFTASLGHLFHDRRLYGWNWDVQVGDAFSSSLLDEAQVLNRRPAVVAVAVGTISRLQIGQLPVDTLAIEPMRGTIQPTVVEGQAPSGPTEILLGTRTLKGLGLGVGATVSVGEGEHMSRMRIVGRGVLTEFAGAARLGDGAAITLEAMRRIVPTTVADVVLLRLRPGPDSAALVAELVKSPPGNVYLPQKPSDLADLQRIGGLPSLIAGLLTVMAVATLAHTLISSVRRRRRDLAIFKVLGFSRSQVSAAVGWQSSVVAVAALAVGLPVGVGAGRWAWRVFAGRLGVPAQPTTPMMALALVIPATVLLANMTAAVPAWLAARTPPTAALRTE